MRQGDLPAAATAVSGVVSTVVVRLGNGAEVQHPTEVISLLGWIDMMSSLRTRRHRCSLEDRLHIG